MILFTVKLIGMIRRAVAGRKYPSQLAWAVAFGLLLGIVPHGNLLAAVLLIVVLSFRVNHAMAALTAIAASFLATKLDPVSHMVGEFLLTQPKFASFAETAWALPMMPWTDLNNTVVLGSLTIGLAALLPVFLITYPVFRFLAPSEKTEHEAAGQDRYATEAHSGQTVMVDQGSQRVPPPKQDAAYQPAYAQPASEPIQFVEVHPAHSAPEHSAPAQSAPEHSAPAQDHAAVETRIDVIRIKEKSLAGNSAQTAATDPQPNSPSNQPMDEALNYLLRQLRDSQSRNAA